ncbi:glycosyltransferase family 2 protein [Ethanoligenens harbinense]|uniref:Glycosyl transferase family 2 n=1 Tax=Ethanoligenens harbinense (strain DSM 18485 / JCM 12961 / CGMCC 1.5033 / YUAN-3) TaxID=663278 RepID=E6U598_ETHHY|nr:glycosyltransferase family 2 protein [Ethanoligenens harbinense]ADU27911.1 glycosyl transferase family 2 [Ethanoligenens harbinense YUAN-3]AVQ96939.1 glycosyltransferase family 2 protein [Ethanoligenens harbinense YUAN-3]AYF39600.1 glycosyltransferase family 2 protein [Ethanoligenens harbinense]AYF42426.1 glycosyltransferase family 2 protein [Ethanoligenens harbinense]
MKLIIQIPCYNEEETLGQTYFDLPRRIPGVDQIEYLIINDGSSDRTVAVAQQLGIDHIVNFKQNRGLAAGFMAGIDACLRLGADIIVNTDADNQYRGSDIARLIAPILRGESDIVVGCRPIDEIDHFSKAKKILQHVGSRVVQKVSSTTVPDAPSGFRAYSREAAMHLNVVNEYTYTLETLIQAGRNHIAVCSVPIHVNPETRKSRLFKSIPAYIRRSASVIIRSFMMYKPLRFFCILGGVLFVIGAVFIARFLILYLLGTGAGHIQSLILAILLILLGCSSVLSGLQADLIASNRKLLEDVQYRIRRIDYENVDPQQIPRKRAAR